MNPTSGDFSKGPKLPFWLAKLLHYKWRFHILAGVLVLLGGLIFLGLKMPWKTDRTLSPSEESSGLAFLNTVNTDQTGEAPEKPSEDSNQTDSPSSPGSSSGDSGGSSGGNSSGGGGSSGGGDSGGGPGGGGGSGGGGSTPPITGGFPTPQSTGPRYASTSTHNGNLVTSQNGQLIERMTINGNLVIRHSGVVVRDVTINGTGRYMLHTDDVSGTCNSTDAYVEYTEVNGGNVSPDQIPVYAQCGGTFDHMYVHSSGRGFRLVNNGTITNSYAIAHRHEGSMHRTAVGLNGGSNNKIIHNTLYCEGSQGCSSAVSAYGDFAVVDGFRLENNLMATTGHYCTYGGNVTSKPYPLGYDVKIINNHFSTVYYPNCGRSGPITSFRNNVRGNECHGNVWHETGQSADDRCGSNPNP